MKKTRSLKKTTMMITMTDGHDDEKDEDEIGNEHMNVILSPLQNFTR